MATRIMLGTIAMEVVLKDIKNIHLSVYPPAGAVRIAATRRTDMDTLRVFAISKLACIKQQQKKLMALRRRGKPTQLRHHSDQGSQYTSEDFQRLLADQGITCSMSRRGECWDNAARESFFSTLKVERVFRSRYKTRDEAHADTHFGWRSGLMLLKYASPVIGYSSCRLALGFQDGAQVVVCGSGRFGGRVFFSQTEELHFFF